jgi:putative endonuclease
MIPWIKQWIRRNREAAHLRSGRWGEKQAVHFLASRKYEISGQRVRVGRHDELDIIAEHEGVLVFIEVKTRRSEQFGRPVSAVNREKRRRLSRAAVGYLRKRKLRPDYIRFDVVEVIGTPAGEAPVIRHIENAFPLDPAYRLWW